MGRGDREGRANLPFKEGVFSSPVPGVGVVEGDARLLENDAPGDVAKYQNRYVAFIDILGFSEIIARSKKEDNLPAQIYNALDFPIDMLIEPVAKALSVQDLSLRVHSFSDNVVISSERDEIGLAAILFACWQLASYWLSLGFMCRGGIASGLVTHKVDGGAGKPVMVFGPAFVEAYVLESKIADFPRIILSKEVKQDFFALRNGGKYKAFSSLVRHCDDGPHCLDVFAHMRAKTEFKIMGNDFKDEAESIGRHLISNLENSIDMPHHFRKVKWLIDHFNNAIDKTNYNGNAIAMT